MFDKNTLAKNIKKYREIKKISQKQLAKALFITPQAVSKWESGITTPDIENLYNIAQELTVSIDLLLNDTSLQKVMLCVDGGGSKTEFLLFTENGDIKNRLVLGGSNPNLVGIDNAYSVLKNGIDTLTNNYSYLSAIFIGAAGMNSGNNAEIVLKKLKKEYGSIPINIKTDIYNVIASSTNEEKCTAVICGTGSVVYASAGDDLKRLGGWGSRLDTSGSGYDIGREALCTALGERDGLTQPSIITRLVEEKLKTTVWESIHDIYEKGDFYIASFAPIVFKAYSLGDKTAEDILKRNAKRLAELIIKADSIYDCGKVVVASGSIISKNKEFSDLVKLYLPPDKELIIPNLPQIYGAGIMCLKLLDIDNMAFSENFLDQYEKFKNEE